MSDLFQDQKFMAQARDLLIATDSFATNNVRLGLGGPFGASLHIYNTRTSEFTLVGSLCANAVLSTGLAGAHAEDQAMSPQQVTDLKAKLSAMASDIDGLYVLMSSSGESCPSCHAKEQILARDLVENGLLLPDRFIVTFGATYEDTASVAGFHDLPYFLDIQKPRGEGAIALESVKFGNVPNGYGLEFEDARTPLAILISEFGVFTGQDLRSPGNLFGDANLNAIFSANRELKKLGSEAPWDVGMGKSGADNKSVLYTTDTDIGPLVYSTVQWANVGKIVSVTGTICSQPEACGIDDATFYQVIGNPEYKHPQSSLSVIRLEPFPNKAQHEWKNRVRQMGDGILYNGAQLA
ncbi:MAG: hypothetical protein RBR86_04060 [Pseudobdellovibrionaceae bacterium]|jgi:hypothetical protein|nr:hypothetical protein [Pseudobdellovibrionaceae bacterium]